jgi:hypothetical protein
LRVEILVCYGVVCCEEPPWLVPIWKTVSPQSY